MTFKIPQDCQTAATRHPHWNDIRDALTERFKHSPDLEKWAVDVVSAHLLGCPERAQQSCRTLGKDAANDVIAICRGYGIDIDVVL